MDMGAFTLFIKLIREDYRLSDQQVEVLTRRMMADEREFERIWEVYKRKARKTAKGVDPFTSILQDLLS